MLHQINLLFRRFLTDARQLFRFFVIVNLIPCILLVFTEPYSFMGKVILVFSVGNVSFCILVVEKYRIDAADIDPAIDLQCFSDRFILPVRRIGDRCRYVSEPGDDQRDGSQ